MRYMGGLHAWPAPCTRPRSLTPLPWVSACTNIHSSRPLCANCVPAQPPQGQQEELKTRWAAEQAAEATAKSATSHDFLLNHFASQVMAVVRIQVCVGWVE